MEAQAKHKRAALARLDSDIDRAVTIVRRDYGGDLQAYFKAVKDHIQNVRQNESASPIVGPDGPHSQSELPG